MSVGLRVVSHGGHGDSIGLSVVSDYIRSTSSDISQYSHGKLSISSRWLPSNLSTLSIIRAELKLSLLFREPLRLRLRDLYKVSMGYLTQPPCDSSVPIRDKNTIVGLSAWVAENILVREQSESSWLFRLVS
jgi:hypothetical protein